MYLAYTFLSLRKRRIACILTSAGTAARRPEGENSGQIFHPFLSRRGGGRCGAPLRCRLKNRFVAFAVLLYTLQERHSPAKCETQQLKVRWSNNLDSLLPSSRLFAPRVSWGLCTCRFGWKRWEGGGAQLSDWDIFTSKWCHSFLWCFFFFSLKLLNRLVPSTLH